MARASDPSPPVHISRYTGIKTLFASSVNHQQGEFEADLEVTAEHEVEIVIHHPTVVGNQKTELGFTAEQWPQFRALILEIIAETDRLMPQVETMQYEEERDQ